MTIKGTDQKPKGICEDHWRRTQRPKITSLPALCFFPNISWQCDEVRFIRAGGSQWRNTVKDIPLAAGEESCLLPPFGLCPLCRACFTVACGSPHCLSGGWPRGVTAREGEVARAWFPELQTETLSHEKYQETRIVPGCSVLDTKWALVS